MHLFLAYLGRFPMEFSILLIIFGFIAVMSISQNRAKERKERLRVIEEAIRSGNLGPDAQQDLVTELTGRRRPRPAPAVPSPAARGRFLFGLGWLGMFLGIGLMAIGDRDTFEPGAVIAAISFGFVSLPLAIRELDNRRRA